MEDNSTELLLLLFPNVLLLTWLPDDDVGFVMKDVIPEGGVVATVTPWTDISFDLRVLLDELILTAITREDESPEHDSKNPLVRLNWLIVTVHSLGMQFAGVLSTSQAPNNFMGRGPLIPWRVGCWAVTPFIPGHLSNWDIIAKNR